MALTKTPIILLIITVALLSVPENYAAPLYPLPKRSPIKRQSYSRPSRTIAMQTDISKKKPEPIRLCECCERENKERHVKELKIKRVALKEREMQEKILHNNNRTDSLKAFFGRPTFFICGTIIAIYALYKNAK